MIFQTLLNYINTRNKKQQIGRRKALVCFH